MNLDIYICSMYEHHTYNNSRVVLINRVRLLIILLVLSWTEKMDIPLPPFAPENWVPRDEFGRLVPCQRAHSILRLNLVLTHGFLPIATICINIFQFRP